AVVALVGVVVYQWLLIESDREQARGPDLGPGVVAKFLEQPVHEIPVGAEDPVDGPSEAPVTMVVFSNFACPGCGDLAHEIPGVRAQVGDRVRVVFKHYPLGKSCDGTAWAEVPAVCRAAWLGAAARRQSRFSELRTRLFEEEPDVSDARLDALAKDLGLTRGDAEDAAVRAKVAADIALGRRVGVAVTPSVYLDGRYVEDLGADVLVQLIRYLAQD
ncbi:MAG: DsbA family protein, partial [Planctomycetota bacterium]|nr:DsbA family protein [Planctomycetota bacterium]